MHVSIQTQFIKDALDAIHRKYPALDTNMIDRVREFLWDGCGSNNLKPFHLEVHDDKNLVVIWDDSTAIVWAKFMPDNTNWEWNAVTTANGRTSVDKGDDSYLATYYHKGACSYITSYITSKGESHYWFPDAVDKLISMPDLFEGTYEPILKKYQYDIVWITNVYDGMLSGYCRVSGSEKDNLHYFDSVEETHYERKRMFAVYQLSWFERIKVWIRYHKWYMTLHSPTLWSLYINKWKRLSLKNKTADQYRVEREKWQSAHKIIGYFER